MARVAGWWVHSGFTMPAYVICQLLVLLCCLLLSISCAKLEWGGNLPTAYGIGRKLVGRWACLMAAVTADHELGSDYWSWRRHTRLAGLVIN